MANSKYCGGREMMGAIIRLVVCLALLSVFDLRSLAQTSTGSITGTVVDPQSLPIGDATVTLTNLDSNTKYESGTSSVGGYQFSRLDSGRYSVAVNKAGFRSGVVSGIKLDTATEYSVVPIRLEVGSGVESVVVEAGEEVVQTTRAEVTGTVEKKQIDDLPILDRNPLALLSLQAGVANSGPGGSAETTINGQRSSFSNVTLDGINIQDNFIRENALDFTPNLPFLSQAQEFTVTEQNGDVDKTGSSSVSMVTPKGTNGWHGEGFWYYRTNAWKANDWFNAASGVPVPGLLQNQGGGNIGGPIIKDKLFIYGYYELLRLRATSPVNTTVLSPAIQAALASSTPSLPFTYQPLDANGDPSGPPVTQDLLSLPNHPPFTIDPIGLAIIQRVPQISNNNRAGDGVNLLGNQFNARNNDTRDNYGFRVDYDLNPHNTITGTYSYNRNVVDRPDIDTSFDTVPLVSNDDHIKFLSTAWRWSPSTNLTNEVRFGFNLAPAFFITRQSFSSGTTIDSADFPFTGPDPNFLPQGRNTHTYSWQDNANWTHGNHSLKFGFQLQRVTIFETDSNGIFPDLQVGFSQQNTNAPAFGDFPAPAGAGISAADFTNATELLATAAGILNNVSQTFNVTSQTSGYVNQATDSRNFRQNDWALYIADNWRINRKLTLNYGVRWEYFTPVDEKNGLVLLPVIPKGMTAAQTLLTNATVDFAGGPSKRGLYNSFYKGFSPNVSLAWDPFGNGKTAVRAGFSMNYVNDSFFTAAGNAIAGNAGLSTTNTADPNGLNGQTLSTAPTVPIPTFGIPTTFSMNAANLGVANNAGYAIDPHLKPPYVAQWNLTIQRDIGQSTSISIGYVGNHGVGLFRAIDVNQVILGSNGFLADFNRARANGFLAASLAPNAPGCTGPNTQNQCGFFNPVFQGQGSQPLTIFPNICGPGGFGAAGPTDGFNGVAFINTDIQQGFAGDLAHVYQEFGCGATPGFFAPNDNIVGGDLLKNGSFSSYNSAVVEIRRRFNRGLYFQANYVFGKVLTDYAPATNNDQSRFQPLLDNAQPNLERGRAPFDFNHQFKANFTYELPFGKGHRLFASDNKLVSLLVDGWQTGSIITWQSGNPFSILSTQPTLNRSGLRSSRNTAFATISPQQIAGDTGVFVQKDGTVYIINPKLISSDGTGTSPSNDLTCVPAVTGGFCNPQPGEAGNLSLYAFTGPVYFNWDLSASKDFHLTERIKLTFRTEAFNVLNHPTFFIGDVNGTFDSENINSQHFGQSTSTVSQPRILQMSLHLKF
jgi:Carboxypeptidase regulatory-like domain/TonB dependent receptor